MQVPAGFEVMQAGDRLWVRPNSLAELLDPMMALSLADLRRLPDSRATKGGRESPFHIPVPSGDGRLLVRPYGRGGLLAGMLPKGFRNLDRGLKELTVGARSRKLGLPVVELAGLGAERLLSGRWAMEGWSWWQADTLPLPESLGTASGNGEDRAALLKAVAEAIRRCHDAGLSHRDLNANNVIVKRESGVFRAALVDLDGADFPPAFRRKSRLAQLRRLYRSLAKEGTIPRVMAGEEYAGLVRHYFKGELSERSIAAFMIGCRMAARWHSLLWRR